MAGGHGENELDEGCWSGVPTCTASTVDTATSRRGSMNWQIIDIHVLLYGLDPPYLTLVYLFEILVAYIPSVWFFRHFFLCLHPSAPSCPSFPKNRDMFSSKCRMARGLASTYEVEFVSLL
jgi:hypothetical protein